MNIQLVDDDTHVISGQIEMSWMRIKASSVSRGCRSVLLRSESSTAVPQVTFEYVHSEGMPPIVGGTRQHRTRRGTSDLVEAQYDV